MMDRQAFALRADGEYNLDMGSERKGNARQTSDRREGLVTTIIITLVFAFLLIISIFLSSSLVAAENLRMENAVERAYSNVIMALRIGGDVDRLLDDENVLGFGYYTHMGTPLYVWGNAYQRLPLTSFPYGTGLNGSYSSYDEDTDIIETVRYASSVMITPDNIFSDGGDPLEFPGIIYISFDASSFAERVTMLSVFSAVAFIVIILLYLMVLRIFRQNNEYRETLRRQESLVRLGEAARTLTHEIKNPLSAIRIELAILKREVPPSLMDDVRIIDHETDRLKRLTDKVSDYLRNPLGNPAILDIVVELRNLIQLFPAGVRFNESSEDSVIVQFDPERLRSVLENLLKNAVEACDGMDIDVEVEVSYDKKGRCVVSVRDRGKGLGDSDEKRIFDPFYTTKIHGSGIGLSISQQFVRAAGGSLRLYSRDGGGTVAEVSLPCRIRR